MIAPGRRHNGIMGFWLLFLLQAAPPPKDPVPATIHGKAVAADTGAPLKRAMIFLRPANGGRRDAGGAITDATGAYEIKNIAPGVYVAECAKSGFISTPFKRGKEENSQITLAEGQEVKDIDFILPRSGVVSGKVVDEYDIPVPGVVVAVQRKVYRQGKMQLEVASNFVTDDRGRYRVPEIPAGLYYVRAAKQASRNDVGPTYAAVFFPNAGGLAEAQAVKVGPGEEVSGINFALHETAVFSVSGKVVDLRTNAAVGGATFFYRQESESMQVGGTAGTAQGKADGTFRLLELTPGRYRVALQVLDPNSRGRATLTQRMLDVPNHNLSGVTFTISPGATLKGRIQAQGGDLPEQLRVQLLVRSTDAMGTDPVFTAPDGTFDFADVQPETYTLTVNPMPPAPGKALPAFFISGITVAGNDVIDIGITVPEGATSPELTAAIDFRGGAIAGKALDSSNAALDGQNIAMVSADPKKRDSGRYFKKARSNATGDYTISGVIPGDYLMVIWPGKDPEVVQDPDVMALLEKHCVRVSVQQSGSLSQELKLIPDVEKIARSFSWF